MKSSFLRVFAVLVACSGLGFLSEVAKADVIRSFHAEIHIQPDTSLDVTESIQMDFEQAQRHGIYRDIPVVYRRNLGYYSIYLDVVSVTDDKGNTYKYAKSRDGDDLDIKIGDADSTLTGLHNYNIHYIVRRAVNFFNGAPEFYWNVAGYKWQYPMLNASARVYPPPGVTVSKVRTESFFGPPGATSHANVKVEDHSILFYTENLQPGSDLTIVAGLPAGSVTPPTALQNFLWFFADWWPLFIFPAIAGSVTFALYMKSGRDVEGNLPAQVEWSPPKDLSPAEVGTLVDESCDMADIVSTLVDLAARGYLRIEEIETKTFLFFQSKDYAFHRNPAQNMSDKLAPHEVSFLRGVFGTELPNSNMVLLSSLKEHFYVYLPEIRDSIYNSLTQKGLFTSNPEKTRSAYQGVGGLLGLLGFALFFCTAFLPVAYALGTCIAAAIVFLSAKAMPAKTATGSRKFRECVGFQRFVRLAEKDRIEKLVTDDPTIFGRLLPYAMVLGVADQWANKFAGLMTEPPDWYSGSGYNNFSTYYFVNSLNGSMNTMGKTFESKPAPQSTGGSGGSGFSGGGSGGGFGGGGGGSW